MARNSLLLKSWVDWRYLPFIIFTISLFLRLLYLFQSLDNPLLYSSDLDEAYYIAFAQHIASGLQAVAARPFFMDPLYGYILGGLFSFTGENLTTIRLIQILVDSASPLLILYIGTRLGCRRAGAIAAIFYALYKVAFFYDLLILKTTFSVSAVLIFMAIFLKIKDSNNNFAWFGLGLFFALTVYLRANFLLLAPLTALFFWYAYRPAVRDFARKAMFFFLGAILLLSLGAVRNYIVSGELVFLSTQSGRTFYTSNNPENLTGACGSPSFARLRPEHLEADFHHEAERRTGTVLTAKEASAYWTRETLLFIKNQPKSFLKALVNKLKLSIHKYEIPVNNSFEANALFAPILKWPLPNFLLAISLGFPGLIIAIRRKKENSFLLVPILTSGITMILFYSSSRFRMPAIPFLLLGGGFLCDSLIDFFKRKEFKKFAGSVVSCLVIVLLISLLPPPVKTGFEEQLLAKAFWAIKDTERAKQIAIYGAQKFPNNVNFPLLLGIIALVNSNNQEAIIQNSKAIGISPTNPIAHHHLGIAYLKTDQPLKARKELQQALLLGHDPKILFTLAETYEATGEIDSALKSYERLTTFADGDQLLLEQAKFKIEALKR
jgi:tetratricopeptide (TPR) repeat protein